MGLSEFAISRALLELQCDREYISIAMVATHVGCSNRTVKRAMKRLIESNTVVRLDGCRTKGGYRYDVR
jgi:predicted transcriptional regulator